MNTPEQDQRFIDQAIRAALARVGRTPSFPPPSPDKIPAGIRWENRESRPGQMEFRHESGTAFFYVVEREEPDLALLCLEEEIETVWNESAFAIVEYVFASVFQLSIVSFVRNRNT
jgi:hypothetical protein